MAHFNTKAKTQNWLLSIFSIFGVFILLVVVLTINTSSAIQKSRYKDTFDQTLWKTLQLQIQYHRFINFVSQITPEDLPLNGALQTEYAYLVNHVDILRYSDIHKIINFFDESNPVKLIYFIHGEVNLLSTDVDSIEQNNSLNTQILLRNLHNVELKIKELVRVTNKSLNYYVSIQQQELDRDVDKITWLVWFLFACLCFFIVLTSIFLYKNSNNVKNITKLSSELESITMNRMRFLSVLNHELRTPINGILSIASILNKSKVNAEQADMLRSVHDSGNTALNNLNAFSDLSRLEANKLALNFSYGNLHKQLEETCQRVSNSGRYPQNHLFSFIDLNLPSHTYSDFGRLNQIFSSLLENAFLHASTHNVSIVIRESPLKTDQWRPDFTKSLDALMIQVSVRAAGITLTEEQRDAITSSFYYLESDDSRKYMSGLNLSICYQLAKVLGGQLQFSTQHGMGDEFWMDIPIYFDKRINKIKEEVAMTKAFTLLEGKKVLIIEEEQPARIISMQVSSLGMIPILETDRLTGPLTMQVDIVIISDDAYLDELSFQQILALASNQCLILSSERCSQSQTKDLSNGSFCFPLTQLELRKTLVHHFQK
ncbi:sensor histidine kinase [Marinomonas sp. 2405UD68-3]|uniref:sensor histidine kinase n=1 Tax=Marinomonas sp. 2405UD68-3 TaxID=3391835 RepID=UPI0039C939A7